MLRELLLNAGRFLCFRRPSPHLRDHLRTYLVFGLICTWLAGIGRYWDNPRAALWQQLGLGSLAYVLVLAGLIYALVKPLQPRRWSYANVLLCITLTAPPAVLYAIPVERFMPLEDAAATNAWFLAVVATWRVALYGWFLRVFGGLSRWATTVALLLPLALIVFALSALNLEHVVFRIMGGILREEQSANDLAYVVVLVLSFFAFWATPILLLGYVWCVMKARATASFRRSFTADR